mgnify:CR=1 FL=1
MIKVVLQGSLKAAAGGRSEFALEATNIRQLLDRLGEAEPALLPVLERGVAVSIDGQLYRDAWYQAIAPDSEVFLFGKMAGG